MILVLNDSLLIKHSDKGKCLVLKSVMDIMQELILSVSYIINC